jgi:hypothetical protein
VIEPPDSITEPAVSQDGSLLGETVVSVRVRHGGAEIELGDFFGVKVLM